MILFWGNHSTPFITGLIRHLLLFHQGAWADFSFFFLFFFVCRACHAFRGCSVDSLPGSGCKKYASLCRKLLPPAPWLFSNLILPNTSRIFSPLPVFLLPCTGRISYVGGRDRNRRHPVNNIFLFSPSALVPYPWRHLTEPRQHAHIHKKTWRAKKKCGRVTQIQTGGHPKSRIS